MSDIKIIGEKKGILRMRVPSTPECYFEWNENTKMLSVIYENLTGAPREELWPNTTSEAGAKLLVLMWTKGYRTARNHLAHEVRNEVLRTAH